MPNPVDDFNVESFGDGTIRLSYTGPFSVLKRIVSISEDTDTLYTNLKEANEEDASIPLVIHGGNEAREIERAILEKNKE